MQMCFAIYKVWEQKCKCILLFTKCGSENAIVFCHLQSVRAKMQMYFAIYKVWERKCNCVLPFTECESENANVFCYLQNVRTKMQMCFAIYKVWEQKWKYNCIQNQQGISAVSYT